MFSIFAKGSILDFRLGSTNVLSKKLNVFFDEEHFCLHWNRSQIEKCGNVVGPRKFQENRMTIIHINSFIKIGSINSFKSWLPVIKLVSWQMCFISPNPPRETLASTSRSPALPRYLPLLQIFLKNYSFRYFFGRSYHYQISHQNTVYKEATPFWSFLAIFIDGSSQPRSQCNVLEKTLLSYRGSFFIHL